MESVVRALVVYLFILLLRAGGKRSLSSINTFDLVLLLIISEATQQALLGDDFSLTTAALVVTTSSRWTGSPTTSVSASRPSPGSPTAPRWSWWTTDGF
ncbi:hypothetical protein [Streptomyces radiopugnans]|uniref:DUF421 domain-containing protein n=1 Tax=Streptomyces radiopugnans TaxID=403935 RepID=A0A1H8ZP35_9ACTN|nr:hypothetical protein [Streptomyces radiopugnans]SEP66135.1 hypothetical protein SAMN05216481_101641 [Streptomyces radiopugnans]